jgi:GH25 family lysozyme M1 (1,4-beta-N-acetylmuramidase)
MRGLFSRRAALAGVAAASLPSWRAWARTSDSEVDLVDDAPLGEMGNFDSNFYGPPETRAVREVFKFPVDAESASAYGIDISHHSKEVPWDGMKTAKVNYVYIKAGQGARNRDPMFETHWAAAERIGMPCGAYHFLSAGVPGKDQGDYFLKRIRDVGGLKSGRHLQPVIDLEWDFLGGAFKRTVLKTMVQNGKSVAIYKDYWSDYSSDEIARQMNDCLAVVREGLAPLGVKPIIYTNRSWWETRLKPGVRFADCTIWTSDYRRASYSDGVPRSVAGHTYHLWQFTERGKITVAGKDYGPFDCNKLVKGSLENLRIV